jgi:6-phosphogluconate dehydrogenase
MKKQLALLGLGKMGANIVRRLRAHGWDVHGRDMNPEVTAALAAETDMLPLESVQAIAAMSAPRLVWLMVPAGKAVDAVISELLAVLEPGDVVMDGGNSFYKDSIAHGETLAAKGIRFIDVGFSGGPAGALNGACLMVGGDKSAFEEFEPLFKDLAKDGDAYQFFPGAGAGHFVKMIHNGIEYGMMQAIAEGFGVLKASPFNISLSDAAAIYNKGSVIESRLIGWTASALQESGEDLSDISSTIGHTGEGEWTVKTAHELGIAAPIIEGSYQVRVQSAEHPSFVNKVVSALRGQFGGHRVR